MNLKKRSVCIVYIIALFLYFGCGGRSSHDDKTDSSPDPKDRENAVLEIVLNTDQTFQTIHNFGASDAWSTQFVGNLWPDSTKEKIATLLFSTQNKEDGSPEGIGLSAWRFNIGAGSTEQGTASSINDEWRRTESFLNADETYSWDKQAGQLWFLETAKNKGVETFIGFVNSPPVYYTKNGKAFSNDGATSNLLDTHYTKYADFLVEVVKGVANKTGVTFDYVSPFNEPQWDWKCCKQEGSPWNNSELYHAVRAIDTAFVNNAISSKIEVTEAAKITYLYKDDDKPNRGSQIDHFFNASSNTYIGGLSTVAPKIAGHSYFTTWDVDKLIDTRLALDREIKNQDTDLEFWMTEYTLLEDNSEVTGARRDLGMAPALYMARIIHADLVLANAAAWHWWLAISPYDYKDGLIYVDRNKFGGSYYESKMLWVLGHYSRFIRPGMKRIAATCLDDKPLKETIKGVLPSAYMSDKEIVIVFVNQFNSEQEIKLSGIPEGYHSLECYQTTKETTVNLQKMAKSVAIDETFKIPGKSLITCVLKKE